MTNTERLADMLNGLRSSSAPAKYGASGIPYAETTRIVDGHRVNIRQNLDDASGEAPYITVTGSRSAGMYRSVDDAAAAI